MAVMPSHPAWGLRASLADVKDAAGGAPLARGPLLRLSLHRRRLQDAVCTNTREAGYAEVMRVRHWSTSSDELATETMHDLTSAPRMLVGGHTVFLNPNTDVKRIHQKLPSPEREGGANWQRLRTATRKPSLPEPSSSKSLQLSVEAILLPWDQSRRSSQRVVTRVSSLPGSSSLRSRVSRASSNDSSASANSVSSASFSSTSSNELTEDAAGWARPRAGSWQKRVPRQKAARTFTPSSRFGDPADWKGGASWTQLIQRAQSQTGQTSSGSHKAAEPGVQGLRRRASENDGGASPSVFQPVRLTW